MNWDELLYVILCLLTAAESIAKIWHLLLSEGGGGSVVFYSLCMVAPIVVDVVVVVAFLVLQCRISVLSSFANVSLRKREVVVWFNCVIAVL